MKVGRVNYRRIDWPFSVCIEKKVATLFLIISHVSNNDPYYYQSQYAFCLRPMTMQEEEFIIIILFVGNEISLTQAQGWLQPLPRCSFLKKNNWGKNSNIFKQEEVVGFVSMICPDLASFEPPISIPSWGFDHFFVKPRNGSRQFSEKFHLKKITKNF